MPAFRRVALPAVLLALVLPLAAAAKLPSSSTKTIVFGKSVGGVAIGSPLSSAKRAWGSGSTCQPVALATAETGTQCVWSAGKASDYGAARMQLTAAKNKVAVIALVDGTGGPKGGIRRYVTAKGIGLGDTLAAFKKAYPKAKISVSGEGTLAAIGSGRTQSSLNFQSGKLKSMLIGSLAG
jgi:hypothetical protein